MYSRLIAPIIFCVLLLLAAGCVSQGPAPQNFTAQPTSPALTAIPAGQASGTDSDLVAFVNGAVVHAQRVGKEAALKEFADQNGLFTRGEHYIWAVDFNGTNLAHPWHPEYAGQNHLNLTDDTGFLLIAAMRDAARNGSGFVSYKYENPFTGKIEPKMAYVKRVDDTWWIASGIYGYDLSAPAGSPDMVRETLEAKVNNAVAYAKSAGKETALAAFNNASGQYAKDGSYIFAFDVNGTTLAMPFEPAKIGKNERNLTDLNGIAIGERKIMLAKEGGGFYYYVYQNPASGKQEFKVSYVQPVDAGWAVGSGTYLPNVSVLFTQARRDQLVTQVNNAASFVQKNGREKAIVTFNDPNGTFSQPDMYIFAFDRNGTLLANPHLPGIVAANRLADRDPYGQYPVPYIIDNAKNGGGFMYYFFADPSTDYQVRLKLTYSKMVGDDLIVGAGIFP